MSSGNGTITLQLVDANGNVIGTNGAPLQMQFSNPCKDLVALEVIPTQAASTDFASFTAPYSGTATLLLSLSTASVVNLMATPSGGTEANLGAVNSGQAVAADEPYIVDFPISSGAKYAFQLATTQTGNLYVHVKGASMR